MGRDVGKNSREKLFLNVKSTIMSLIFPHFSRLIPKKEKMSKSKVDK